MSKLMGGPDGVTPLEPEEMEGLRHKHDISRGPKECMSSTIEAVDAKPLF